MAARDEGLSQPEAAARFGCGRKSIGLLAREYGIAWPRRGDIRPTAVVEVAGERLTLAQAAARYDLPYGAISKRYTNGDRGERLVRPLRKVTPAPSHYDLGLSRADWEVILEDARQRTPLLASRRFEVPLGAVNAALHGEWERLG